MPCTFRSAAPGARERSALAFHPHLNPRACATRDKLHNRRPSAMLAPHRREDPDPPGRASRSISSEGTALRLPVHC